MLKYKLGFIITLFFIKASLFAQLKINHGAIIELKVDSLMPEIKGTTLDHFVIDSNYFKIICVFL